MWSSRTQYLSAGIIISYRNFKQFQTHHLYIIGGLKSKLTCALLLLLKGNECYNSIACIEFVGEGSTTVLSDNHYLSIYMLFLYIYTNACFQKVNGMEYLCYPLIVLFYNWLRSF